MLPLLIHRTVGLLLIACLTASSAVAQDPPPPSASPTSAAKTEFFEKKIRPLLIKECIACHGSQKAGGGLRLDTQAGRLRGGDGGPVIVARDPESSVMIRAVRRTGELKMPPKHALQESEIAVLVQWIRDGAHAPPDSEPTRIGNVTVDQARRWWSFQPIVRPAVPRSPYSHPIDAFIHERLREKGLRHSGAADKRTLLRRVTLDLTGLPPTWEELADFERDDSPEAFAKVVDRLLAAPQYGERWGRHWLDLVRYADTAGDNSDHPLPHAWRYRNWVIDALNRDLPYDVFLREQIAGDLMAATGPPDRYAGRMVATGFLAMARRFEHDSDKAMHLTHEDGIDTIGKALLGLTLGCARCHDHKYDAVSTRDYYALYGILDSSKFSFAGCEAKQQPRDLVPLIPPDQWNRVVRPHQEQSAKLEAEIRAETEARLGHARTVQGRFQQSRNVVSTGEIADGGDKRFPDSEITVKAGQVVFLSITPQKNHGADTTRIEFEIAEVDGKKRTWNAVTDLVDDLLSGNPHADRHGHAAVWWLLDTRRQPLPLGEAVRDVNGKAGLYAWRTGDTPSAVVNATKAEIAAWTKLAPRSLFLHPASDGNVGLVWLSPVDGKVKITGRIQDAHPGGPDGVGWVLEHFTADVRDEMLAIVKGSERRTALDRRMAELRSSAPKQEVAFAVVEGNPADARIQTNGDPEKLGVAVPRRWLEVFGGAPIASPKQSGRLDLANWIASKENPLTARVMVNRIWLHHFGKGLVGTPNDFGTRGMAPTHPQLLDWLAAEFIASGWSLKAMHRKIVLSETYRQACEYRADSAAVDVNNDLYWRFNRRRMSAEELRDGLMAVAGSLDRTAAEGHPFPPESRWGYTQHVPFSTFFETDRRSVYLIHVRNRRHPFLGLFDGADPNATTPARQATTVPTQALYFMNDPFFHAQAEKLMSRVTARPESERLAELFRRALQRDPSDRDREFAVRFLDRYQQALTDRPPADRLKVAWSALARVVLAGNEFLYVE